MGIERTTSAYISLITKFYIMYTVLQHITLLFYASIQRNSKHFIRKWDSWRTLSENPFREKYIHTVLFFAGELNKQATRWIKHRQQQTVDLMTDNCANSLTDLCYKKLFFRPNAFADWLYFLVESLFTTRARLRTL